MARTFTDWEGTCLMHHGIKGQKWGVRRFQNPDGTLTELGKKRNQKGFYKGMKQAGKESYIHDLDSLKGFNKRIEKMIPGEKLESLVRLRKAEERKFRKGKPYDETVDTEYGKAKDKLVEELLGRYGRKNASAMRLERSISDIVDNRINAARENRKAFEGFKKAMSSKDPFKWIQDNAHTENFEKTISYIDKKASKPINEWWNKKTSSWRNGVSSEVFSAEAKRYAREAARELGLPANEQTLYFLLDWFFNGDD